MREVPFADLDVDEIDIPAFLLSGPEDDEDAPEPAVVLPPSGTGIRRDKRRQRRRESTRRTTGLVLLAVGLVAVIVLVLAHPWRSGAPATPHHPAAGSRSAPLPSSAVP